MKDLCIAAAIIAVIPVLFALMSPEFHLGDQKNAVEEINLKDKKVDEAQSEKEEKETSGVAIDATQQA